MSYPFDYYVTGKGGQLIPRKKQKYTPKQEDFFDVQEWRIKHDRSNIIINVGEQGSGKSNTGMYLITAGNKIFYKKKTDFDLHVYNSITDFVKNFSKLRNCYVLLEEVGVELNSKDSGKNTSCEKTTLNGEVQQTKSLGILSKPLEFAI